MDEEARKLAQDAAELLDEIRRLLVLKGENPFKIRAYENAREVIVDRSDLKQRAREGTLTELSGIGKSIAELLSEFLLQGKSTTRDQLASELPAGLAELTRVPGLGPKKAQQLIEQLGIRSLGELEEACLGNRLQQLKGFGEKVQAKILEGVRFAKSQQGQQRLGDVLGLAQQIRDELKALLKGAPVEETGALRRRLEIVTELEFLVCAETQAVRAAETRLRQAFRLPLPLKLHVTEKDRFGWDWARTTATPAHWNALGDPASPPPGSAQQSEDACYRALGLEWIPPECRETGEEVALTRKGALETLFSPDQVKGVFHNHTTASDGTATIDEMVRGARALGFRYLGISDHSQSAHYAGGLDPKRLERQQREIRAVQERYPDIRIFWGIESDILGDGSLDYPDEILSRFDFVVASVHSRFKMEEKEMTERILKAIRNPFTRFLGHATGRLLLSRPGYSVDLERVIEEAAKHDVAIEINANPLRLDIDWRWGPVLRKAGTRVCINPDAHSVEELKHVAFGVTVARKALLPGVQVLNSCDVTEVERWLSRKK